MSQSSSSAECTSIATVTNARPAPVERGDTTPLHDRMTISLFFPRRPYAAGSSETRQQCSRFGRIAGNLLVVFIMRYIYTRSFVPLPAVQFFFFISSADPIRRAKQRRRAFSSE